MSLSLQEILTQIFGFLILVAIMKRLFWKPLLHSLESRRQHIRQELDGIEASKKEMESLKAEYAAHLQKIEEEVRGKIQEAIDQGRRISREIQEKARAEAQATFEKSRENLELEVAKARMALKREIAELAIAVSEKVLQEKMKDPKHQEEKVLQIIEELEKSL